MKVEALKKYIGNVNVVFKNYFYVCMSNVKCTTMKKLLLLIFFVSFGANAQELTQNESTKRWEYIQVFESKGKSAKVLYKRIIDNYIQEASTIQSQTQNKKIVLRYLFRLGTFKWAKVTETFNVRDGKIRWKLNNIVYLKAVTSASKYKRLDETSDKKIIKKINKLLPDWIKGINDSVISKQADEDEEDW